MLNRRLDDSAKKETLVPIDKLIVINSTVRHKFEAFAEKFPGKDGYRHFVRLKKTKFKIPVNLYVGGFYNDICKIQFLNVSSLSLHTVVEILKELCGNVDFIKIYRIDWAVDIPGITAFQLAQHCRVARTQTFAVFRHRRRESYYLHFSKERKILVYDRSNGGRPISTSSCSHQESHEPITRVEVQLFGKGVPFRRFTDILLYANVELLRGITYLGFRPMKLHQKPMQRLAGIGMQSLIRELGLQGASKQFPASSWATLSKKFLEAEQTYDLPRLLQASVRDWLHNRRRFPRLASNHE